MEFLSINPASEEILAHHKPMNDGEIGKIIQSCHSSFASWKKLSYEERGAYFNKLADVLEQKKDKLARLMAAEMGKPISQGWAEIEKCTSACRYFSSQAATYLQADSIPTEASKSYVTFQPIGTVFAVMPWNYPFWQVFRVAAPTMMAGNTLIIKHAPNVLMCAKAIEDLFKESGFPENVFRQVVADIPQINPIIASPFVQGVTLTGSVAAGKAIATLAGQNLKKCVLELGGSDPFVVLDDADLSKAVDLAFSSRMQNCGQVCIAAKRIIVTKKNYESFIDRIRIPIKGVKMGNPLDPATLMGPMARRDLRSRLTEQVNQAIRKGASLLEGGHVPTSVGYYYPATLLTDIKPGSPAFDEEIFGPIFCVTLAKDEAEALELANKNIFGLGATVISADPAKAEAFASQIDAGATFINTTVKSDFRLPFGGTKKSGFGRELGSYGIKEFVNIKTVWVE